MRVRARTLLTGNLADAMVSRWGWRRGVKVVQRGTIVLNNQTSNTATLSLTVNTNNAVLHCLGFTGGGASTDMRNYMMSIELTNGTTVTAKINTAAAVNHTISYEVVEYWPGAIKSLQRGVLSATASGQTQTITAVDTTRAQVILGGYTQNVGPVLEADTTLMRLDLSSATAVRFTHDNLAAGTFLVPYQVVEWF